jgi:hypothetical protein
LWFAILFVGDRERALGALVLAWLAGKREWNKTGLGLPLSEWTKLDHADDIAQAGLASLESGERVVLKGARDKFGKQGGKRAPSVPTVTGTAAWAAYSEAYARRYNGQHPVRNGQVNSQMKAFTVRLGGDAPAVAAFYLSHNDSFYVRALHPVGLLLRDAEKLRTEWAMQKKMTGTLAREIERVDQNRNSIDAAFERLKEKGAHGHSG